MYKYAGCGLDYVYLKNGYTKRETPYGEGVSIHDLDGLHKAIAMDIVKNRATLSGAELRFLRLELGFSQRRLGELVGKEAQTVALWEKGKNIDPGADKLIRIVVIEMLKETPHIVELIDRINELDRTNHQLKRTFSEINGAWIAAA